MCIIYSSCPNVSWTKGLSHDSIDQLISAVVNERDNLSKTQSVGHIYEEKSNIEEGIYVYTYVTS